MIVSEEVIIQGGTLMCPCSPQGEYMHQDMVRIIHREEDMDGVATTVDCDSRIVQADVPENEIAGQRQVMEIDFLCEICGGGIQGTEGMHTLQINQHKGTTLLKWLR